MTAPRLARGRAAAALAAVAALGGCGGGSSGSSTTVPTAPPTSPAPRPPAALTAGLLTVADIPGSARAPAAKETEIGACFPGNPVAAKGNPNQAVGPALAVASGKVQRTYSSSATDAGPKQAAAYVATFASPAGSACLVSAIKTAIGARAGAKADAAGLTGGVKALAVADGGAILSVKGTLKVNGSSVPAAVDLVAFHKGQVVVLLSAGALGGGAVPGQAADLARRLAGRLP